MGNVNQPLGMSSKKAKQRVQRTTHSCQNLAHLKTWRVGHMPRDYQMPPVHFIALEVLLRRVDLHMPSNSDFLL